MHEKIHHSNVTMHRYRTADACSDRLTDAGIVLKVKIGYPNNLQMRLVIYRVLIQLNINYICDEEPYLKD